MILALVVLAVLLAAAAGCLWWWSTHGVLASRHRRKVVVTLKSGTAFQGLLTVSDRHAVVLTTAQLVGDPPVPVDGEVVVFRGDVHYIQRP